MDHHSSDPGTPIVALEDLEGTAREFLDSLGRLYVNCTVYPPEHPQIVTACEELRASLQPLLLGQDRLTLLVTEGQVRMGPVCIPDLGAQGQRFLKDVDLLGIGSIVMDPRMAPGDLLTLCQTLREAVAASMRHNGSPDEHLGKLRGPVAVQQRDYGMPTFTPDERSGVHQQLVQEVLKPLEDVSLDRSTHEHLVRFIDQVLLAAHARQRPGGEPRRGGNSKGALSEEDLAAVAALQLRRLIETHIDRNQGLKDLHALFHEFEDTLSFSTGNAAARFLATEIRDTTEVLLKDYFQAQPSSRTQPRQQPARPETPVLEDDVAHIRELVHNHRLPTNLLITDHTEYLGILFQTLLEHHDLSAEVVRTRLERVLSHPLPDTALQTLQEGTTELCRRGDVAALDQILPSLSRSLRPLDPCLPGRIFREACATHAGDILAALWPHVANEILLGIPEHEDRLREDLYALLARQPLEDMRQNAPRLAAVSAIAERSYSPQAFSPARVELYPLYLVLLSLGDLAPLWKLLLHGLRGNSPPNAAGAAVVALGRLDFNERRFLGEILREAHERRSSEALKTEAATFLARALRALGPEQRGESWVVPAIKALGKLRCPPAEQMLDEIESSRTRLFRYQWPAACRGAVQASRFKPSRR